MSERAGFHLRSRACGKSEQPGSCFAGFGIVDRDEPIDTALVLRIGLHLGGLIFDGDDHLYGGGVNVAARSEG